MSKTSWIYCLRGNDGSFYYGSTTKGVKQRYWDHKTRAKHFIDMKVYKHFNTIGWENVIIEEVEMFESDRKGRIEKENTYIMPKLNNKLCLNSKCSSLTNDEKIEHMKEAQGKHHEKNKEKRNQHSRDYYYLKKYGITEQEYKNTI